MDVIAGPVLKLIVTVVDLYVWIIVIGVVLSWLTAFKVVNTSNRLVYMIGDFTHCFTEPALRRIRRYIPNLGGMDISPVVLILGLIFLQRLILWVAR